MLQITTAGKVGRTAELRTTQQGTKVLGFSVATDVGFGDKKTTVWLDCAIWGDRAVALAPYITKGSSITIIGEGGLRVWEKDGKSGSSITVNVREVALQGGKREDGGRTEKPTESGYVPDMDDEIPF